MSNTVITIKTIENFEGISTEEIQEELSMNVDEIDMANDTGDIMGVDTLLEDKAILEAVLAARAL